MFCERCFHPGCAASVETVDGERLCYFCADGEPCPVHQREQQLAKRNVPHAAAVPIANSADQGRENMENANEVQAPTPVRICKKPGCTVRLSPKNSSGKCADHWHWNETPKPRPSSGNGHASTRENGSNGNGAHTPDLVESRLDRLFASLSLAEKTKIASAWIRGEI